jgi:Dolichyl-phosphate-mannose-protein mannosyltransferase
MNGDDEPAREWQFLLVLVVAALVIELVLLRFTTLMSLREFFPGREGISLDFVKMLGPDWVRNTWFQASAFALMFVAFGAALWAFRQSRTTPATLATLFAPPLVWSATAAFMYPPYAVDLFHNLADSRMLWLYRLNPMVVAPIARPFIIGTSYGDQTSAYGPLWYLLNFPGAVFQPQNYLSSIILLKLWMAIFYIASGALILLTLRRTNPRLALLGAALYLWNPFVLMRVLGDAHNDVVMFFFVLVALYFATTHEWLGVAPALTLSALIKYVSVLLGPLVLVYVLMLPAQERRHALPRLFAGVGIAAVLAVIIYLPFWAGPRTFSAILGESKMSITSTPLLVQLLITGPLLRDTNGDLSRLLMRVVFLVPYGFIIASVRPPIRRLYAGSYQVLFLFVFLAVAWFRPWYLLWVVALGALLPSGWFLALTLAISFCGMFPDIIEQYRNFMPFLAGDALPLYEAPVVVAFVAPALIWIAAFLKTGNWFFETRSAESSPTPADSSN